METQINVAADDGYPVEDKRNTFSDGLHEWWNIRIPKNAATEPHFRDYDLSWPLEPHVEGIGCTGWNWKNRCSRWVAFDFDSITGHAAGVGITDSELEKVRQRATELTYVEVRRSTGGKGLHLYVYLDDIPTANHTEHAALARTVLGMMSTEAGFDFAAQVDVCGGNMWIWHRKMTAENQGLSVVKPSEAVLSEDDLPANWRDHIDVVTRRRSKVRVQGVPDEFEQLAARRPAVSLDEEHRQIIDALVESGHTTVWVPEHGLVQTHTVALAEVFERLKLKGSFETQSEGRDPGTPNCFMFPELNGAWAVYRFGPGTSEHPSWDHEGTWTRCDYNRPPRFEEANAKGMPDGKGYYHDNADDAIDAIRRLTGERLTVPDELRTEGRQFRVVPKGDTYRLHARKVYSTESCPAGWCPERGYFWISVLQAGPVARLSPAEVRQQFHQTRQGGKLTDLYHCDGSSRPLAMKRDQATSTIRHLLGGDNPNPILDDVIANRVQLVFEPFADILQPGKVNIGPQLVVEPTEGDCPTWLQMLDRLGASLTPALNESEWATANQITTGGRYLLLWCAWLFQEPRQRVPAIAFYGPSRSGKSTLVDALAELISRDDDTQEGAVDAAMILQRGSQFAGQVATSVICKIEEVNIRGKDKRDRLNSWITSPKLTAEFKGRDAFAVPNHLHLLMTCNDPGHIPVYDDDTRIVVIEVAELQGRDPHFPEKLRKEQPAFLHHVLHLELPPLVDRLGLLPIVSEAREELTEQNQTVPERFASECLTVTGDRSDFLSNREIHEAFEQWVLENGLHFPVEDSVKTSRQLGSWYALKGAGTGRRGGRRGRTGLKLRPAEPRAARPDSTKPARWSAAGPANRSRSPASP